MQTDFYVRYKPIHQEKQVHIRGDTLDHFPIGELPDLPMGISTFGAFVKTYPQSDKHT